MSPDLRLASILITQRSMLPVFDHIANGMVVDDVQGEMYIDKGPLEGTDLGHVYVQQVFNHMASHSYFDFLPVFALPGQHPQAEQYSTAFQFFRINKPRPRGSMDVPQSYLVTTTMMAGEQT